MQIILIHYGIYTIIALVMTYVIMENIKIAKRLQRVIKRKRK